MCHLTKQMRANAARLLWASAFLGSLTVTPSANACPVCRSATGRQVRAGLFNEDFGFNLLASLLPFPIFLGIVAAIHGVPGRGPAANQEPSRPPGANPRAKEDRWASQ
jgi:hypothetical protein